MGLDAGTDQAWEAESRLAVWGSSGRGGRQGQAVRWGSPGEGAVDSR